MLFRSYLHREAELIWYREYITAYFASSDPAGQGWVLNLNKAIQRWSRLVNNVSLDQFKNSGSWRCDTYLAKPQEISLDHKISGEDDQVGEAKMLAEYSAKGSAPGKQLTAITGACVLYVEKRDMLRRTAQAKRVEQYVQRGEQPRKARTYIWENGEDKTGPTVSYLLTASHYHAQAQRH